MRRSTSSIVVAVLIGLAVIGVGWQLIDDTAGFFRSMLMWIGSAVIIGGILYYFLGRRGTASSSNDMQKYKKAVKQSKQKYKQATRAVKRPSSKSSPQPAKGTNVKKKKRSFRDRSRAPQLRVIEGNKHKRKKSSV